MAWTPAKTLNPQSRLKFVFLPTDLRHDRRTWADARQQKNVTSLWVGLRWLESKNLQNHEIHLLWVKLYFSITTKLIWTLDSRNRDRVLRSFPMNFCPSPWSWDSKAIVCRNSRCVGWMVEIISHGQFLSCSSTPSALSTCCNRTGLSDCWFRAESDGHRMFVRWRLCYLSIWIRLLAGSRLNVVRWQITKKKKLKWQPWEHFCGNLLCSFSFAHCLSKVVTNKIANKWWFKYELSHSKLHYHPTKRWHQSFA